MALFLLLVGVFSGVLFILNNILRTAQRRKRISFWEMTLAFFVLLLPIAAFLLDNLNDARFDVVEQAAFLIVIPLFITSIALTVVEGFRPQRWRQSRGILGLGIAILLVATSFGYAFFAEVVELSAPRVRVPTPVNSLTAGQDPCEALFAGGATQLSGFFVESTGLSQAELATIIEGDGSVSIAQLVSDQGGDVDAAVTSFQGFVEDTVNDAIADECIPPIAGALINQVDLGQVIEEDFDTVLELFSTGFGFLGGGDDVDQLSEEDLQATRAIFARGLETLAAGTEPPTATPTPTATLTSTPTATRTPRPTFSPFPTVARFFTPTPTLTPTLPSPCLASANFNVNMRDYPSLDNAEVLLTIPFEANFSLFYANEDRTWWYGEFEGQGGWVSDEFISLTRPCADLPTRSVPPRLE